MTRHDSMPRRRRLSSSGKRNALFERRAQSRFRRLGLERLEDRRLLAIGSNFGNGGLNIVSDADDAMEIGCDSAGQVTVNGFPILPDGQPVLAKDVRALSVFGGPGDNRISLFLSADKFSQLTGTIHVSGGAGNDLLEVRHNPSDVEVHGGGG